MNLFNLKYIKSVYKIWYCMEIGTIYLCFHVTCLILIASVLSIITRNCPFDSLVSYLQWKRFYFTSVLGRDAARTWVNCKLICMVI
jgi:hypothetical protein